MWGMDSFAEQLKAARTHKGWSRAQLSHATGEIDKRPYISEPTIEAIEIGKTIRPSDETILRLGAALNVADDELPAYHLARARQQLDEWQVGDIALEHLRAIEEASRLAGQAHPLQGLEDLVQRLRAEQRDGSPEEPGGAGGIAR